MSSTFNAIVLLVGAALAPAAASKDVPGRLIDVGERRLHLVCEGIGSPTIVFESGSGEGWYTWVHVQRALAPTYRTCSHDRAGIGFSDPREGRSVASLNEDLHDLLRQAGEKPPFLLVGHSLGGILVRRYEARYPKDVAGIVLVDSAHDDFDSHFPPAPEEQERSRAAREARRKQIEDWRANGTWPAMEFHDGIPRELKDVLRPRSATAAWWDARFAESGLPDTRVSLSAEERRLDGPLVVITATQWPRPAWRTAERHAAWLKARAESQSELASRSKQSRHLTVAATHYLLVERPQIVIDAVRDAAEKWRTGHGPNSNRVSPLQR